MATYRCPESIADMFDDPVTIAQGRKLAFEWADKLELHPGDQVWLPGIGWVEKTGPRQS